MTGELARLAVEVDLQEKPKGLKAQACLVFGADHGCLVRKARDEAKQRIFVASHRMSEVALRSVLLPAIAAANQQHEVSSLVYFNRASGSLSQSAVSELVMMAGKNKVALRPVHDPRLHAKLLAWDDDSVVITSQNWLSSDVSDSSPLQEIGIFIESARVADHLIRTFDNAHIA